MPRLSEVDNGLVSDPFAVVLSFNPNIGLGDPIENLASAPSGPRAKGGWWEASHCARVATNII